jgi:hypothetical protein
MILRVWMFVLIVRNLLRPCEARLYGIETGGELVVPAGQVGVRPCDGMSGTQYCCDGTLLNAGDFSCCSTFSNLFFSIAAATSVVATIPGSVP